NNSYAMGTALGRSESNPSILAHARVFRIEGEALDGMDVRAVSNAASVAVEAIRAGEGPRFVEANTYRFRAHSMFDPDLYREKTEIEAWKEKGPVLRLQTDALEAGLLDESDIEKIESDVAVEIDAAVEFSETAEWEPVETLTQHVYGSVGRIAT
ncbi:MAG: thiamine pyrophosphate-dependent enzyme, partial [Alphaproteobacteria bacterium]